MPKVAFFVDGHFLFRRIALLKSFHVDGPAIRSYCERHLRADESFYRIFYYDSPPLERKARLPFGKEIDFGATSAAKRMKDLLQSIRETPEMALRVGKVAWQNDWLLKEEAFKHLISGIPYSFTDKDFFPNIKQKAVDMKIGLDIATITFKKLADRIVLIAGDSDFTPAAKLARIEGMHVTLDALGNKIPDDLLEHVDVTRTCLDPKNEKDVSPAMRRYFGSYKKHLD